MCVRARALPPPCRSAPPRAAAIRDGPIADEIAQVNYRARTALNNLENSREQVELFEQTVENYKKLYESEVFLFEIGESSLFLVNLREKSWLKAQIKLLELKTKNQVSKAELNFNLAVYN